MPQSNHPPRMMKNIIFSLVKTYHQQNSKQEDYLNMCAKLFQRHVARGWEPAKLKSWIMEADKRLRCPFIQTPTQAPTLPMPLSNHSRLFLHLQYHKNDIPKQLVRSVYNLHYHPTFLSTLGRE